MYQVEILSTSKKDLTPRETLMLKEVSDAVKLDDLVPQDGTVTITPADYAILKVHNDLAENNEYQVTLIIDTDGNKYRTGSASFQAAFVDIWEAMCNGGDTPVEEFSIKMYKMKSKNYNGHLITCSIA